MDHLKTTVCFYVSCIFLFKKDGLHPKDLPLKETVLYDKVLGSKEALGSGRDYARPHVICGRAIDM